MPGRDVTPPALSVGRTGNAFAAMSWVAREPDRRGARSGADGARREGASRAREEAGRLRSNNDCRVNLKAELEIRHLHEKMDHLVTKQWQRLAEIQQIQLEMLQEMRACVARKPVVKVEKEVGKKRPKAAAQPAPDPAAPADASAPPPGAPPPGPAG